MEAGEQFPTGEGNDAGKKSVAVSVGEQVATAFQFLDGIKHIAFRFMLRPVLLIITFRVKMDFSIFQQNHILLLHELNVPGAEPGNHAGVFLQKPPT